MKLSILTDNNTLIDRYFYGEPGFSAFLENQKSNILFDTGYSDVFLKNAIKLGFDLTSIDYLIISHAHNDHTGGLSFLIEEMKALSARKKPVLIAHPDMFRSKYFERENIGLHINEKCLQENFSFVLAEKPYFIDDNIIFLGQIPGYFDFESRRAIGSLDQCDGEPDLLFDDSALVYKSQQGLVIVTGCSHSGICNIVRYAQEITGEQRVVDVIGGLHLLNASEERLQKTIEFFKKVSPKRLHACHCTDLQAKIALGRELPLCEIGSGAQLLFE